LSGVVAGGNASAIGIRDPEGGGLQRYFSLVGGAATGAHLRRRELSSGFCLRAGDLSRHAQRHEAAHRHDRGEKRGCVLAQSVDVLRFWPARPAHSSPGRPGGFVLVMAPLRLPLALRILLHTPGRLAVSIAGIVLAVVLMFSQAGFRNAMFDSQTELIHHLNGDLFLVSRLKYLLYARDTFPRRRLEQVRACPGVQAVYPLYMETTLAIWKNPVDGGTRPIRVLAFNLDDPVLDLPEVRAQTRLLRMPNTILFDDKSRDYFGQPTTGTETELSGRLVHVMGTFQLGTDFVTDGNVLMSDRNFLKFFPDRASSAPHLDRLEIGLVRLTPGTDLLAVQRELRETLPDDVKVLTKAELAALE